MGYMLIFHAVFPPNPRLIFKFLEEGFPMHKISLSLMGMGVVVIDSVGTLRFRPALQRSIRCGKQPQ